MSPVRHRPSRARAVVFDCDGLLLDTEPLWEVAERAFLTELGGTWHPRLRRLTLGRSVAGSARLLAEEAGARLPEEDAATFLVQHFEKAIARTAVPPMPGALALLDALAATDTPLAVASNSPAPVLERLLRQAGVRERFTTVVAAGAGLAPKPAPDVYRTACDLLGVEPSSAHALEDSQPGVDAARAAGLTVTGVSADRSVRLHGCRRVQSLGEVTLGMLGAREERHG
ncbi:HAD family hydrolase [Streptomyces sparsogenes]|uniref:HAD family hydrolase n=1 Tax=Streptomyces sparsogenes TaxID=67365 RepID=UPI0033CE675B